MRETDRGTLTTSQVAPSAVILMPAFNEADVIADVLMNIRAVCDLQVIVIDDASTDTTIAEATMCGATVIPLAARLGAWGATQTGLRYALKHGYEYVITMDADGQHEASSLPLVLRPVTEGNVDVTIGACIERGSLLRRIAWVMMKRTSGLRVQDITSGFRVYNRKAILELASWRATLLDYQDVGILLLLQAKGLKILDVQVDMQARRNGGSRIFYSWFAIIFYIFLTLILGASKRRMTPKNTDNMGS